MSKRPKFFYEQDEPPEPNAPAVNPTRVVIPYSRAVSVAKYLAETFDPRIDPMMKVYRGDMERVKVPCIGGHVFSAMGMGAPIEYWTLFGSFARALLEQGVVFPEHIFKESEGGDE